MHSGRSCLFARPLADGKRGFSANRDPSKLVPSSSLLPSSTNTTSTTTAPHSTLPTLPSPPFPSFLPTSHPPPEWVLLVLGTGGPKGLRPRNRRTVGPLDRQTTGPPREHSKKLLTAELSKKEGQDGSCPEGESRRVEAARRRGGSKRRRTPPRKCEGTRRAEGPKFRRFFPFFRQFRSFFFLWGLLVEVWPRFKAMPHPRGRWGSH